MLLTYITFFLGFVFLIKGADWLVKGGSSLAKRWGVSNLMIGLTVVSFGTSAAELIVNLVASFSGSNDIAIGNILGSNISNILLILGVAALIYPLSVGRGTVWREIPFGMLAIVALGLLVNDNLIDKTGFSTLSRIDGVILLLFFVIFIYYVFVSGKVKGDDQDIEKLPSWRSYLMVGAGMVGLLIGGQLIVSNGMTIARTFGLSEAFIGLTIIAVGTSLPELVTSAVAAYHREADIAIGNIAGSNVFNILLVLGLSSVIKPLSFSPDLNMDVLVVIFSTVILFVFMLINRGGMKKHALERGEGAVLVGLYIAYVIYLVIRI
jgi:cation:H+ antiporter